MVERPDMTIVRKMTLVYQPETDGEILVVYDSVERLKTIVERQRLSPEDFALVDGPVIKGMGSAVDPFHD
jgi:hypothetical protein